MKKAVLLSGGMDSIALTYYLKPDFAYTINYGQACAKRELLISEKVCKILNINHKQIDIDCSDLGSGLLINQKAHTIAPSKEWWPFRNQLLITLSLMQAIKDQVNEIHLASVKNDSFHKDGTYEFYKMINALSIYQEGSIKVKCETLQYQTHELVLKYNVPHELLLLAHSCHISNIACGTCPGCKKQLKVKQELKIE
ncbi:7-cyano-7-deazaguanine synthase [Carboxylicivirga sp. A043]|uniref:7-cyano-7-deazaguanine synthase n=1 Tax=Carboxylicivirga litoralis TaxID=2816963 RepID=UPI0021CB0614|nr:7-cyano-7-deazaguanine synthase [Carboxylicivirga sp. A043]MCU4157453.1 7-cyano-7-deazaguanine synthase [Carboxylicivirga sp. A043]